MITSIPRRRESDCACHLRQGVSVEVAAEDQPLGDDVPLEALLLLVDVGLEEGLKGECHSDMTNFCLLHFQIQRSKEKLLV